MAYLPGVKELSEKMDTDQPLDALKRVEEFGSKFTAEQLVSMVEEALTKGEIKESPEIIQRIEKLLAEAKKQLRACLKTPAYSITQAAAP